MSEKLRRTRYDAPASLVGSAPTSAVSAWRAPKSAITATTIALTSGTIVDARTISPNRSFSRAPIACAHKMPQPWVSP